MQSQSCTALKKAACTKLKHCNWVVRKGCRTLTKTLTKTTNSTKSEILKDVFVSTGRTFTLNDFSAIIHHKEAAHGKKTDYVMYNGKYMSVYMVTKKMASNPIKSIKPTEPIKSAKPTKSTKPTEPIKSTKPTNPIKSTKPAEPNKSTTERTEPTEKMRLAKYVHVKKSDRISVSYTSYQLSDFGKLLDHDSHMLPSFTTDIYVDNNTVDHKWIKANDDYIKSLSTYDIYTLYGYTLNSNIHINAYIRGTFSIQSYWDSLRYDPTKYIAMFMQIFSLIDQAELENPDLIVQIIGPDWNWMTLKASELLDKCRKETSKVIAYPYITNLSRLFTTAFMNKVLDLFSADLSRIIMAAPLIEKDMHVFRGDKDVIDNNNYHAFVSTTLSPLAAQAYILQQKCCVKRMFLKPGTRAIFLQGISQYQQDIEVLLDKKSKFRDQSEPYNVYINSHNSTSYFFRSRTVSMINVDTNVWNQ